MVGTALYAAPEVFEGKYNEKCDTWVTIINILYNQLVNRSNHVHFVKWASSFFRCQQQ